MATAALEFDMARTKSTSPSAYQQNASDNNNHNSRRRNSKMTSVAMAREGITPLMLACQQGRLTDVQHILRKKKDAIREQTRTKKVALHYCAEGGNVSCLELILESSPAMLNAQDEEGYTPLHFAVINGNRDAVKSLITFQADVNCLDNEGHSLIHWATVCGEVEILDILLNAGSLAATPDSHLAHPIHYAAQMCGAIQTDSRAARVQSTVYGVSPKKGLAILRRLLLHRVPVDVRDQDGRQPLLWAASAGSADAILVLVNAGATVEAEDKDGLTALHCAASRGHVDCLENLIGLCGAEVDVIDNNGCTALFYAVTLGHADCTELLLNYGAEPNRQDRKGRTPAHTGAAKGQLETIKLFAKHGGNLWMRNVRGDLPLHEAVLSRRKDLVMWLLSQRPETVNAPNNDGRCPIHLAALNNNVEMVKILIDHHAEVNALMRTGKGNAVTPLDAAIHMGNSTVAKFLQLHGSLPANSLNDISLQRRLNRSLDSSQARTISSLQESHSQLGSHIGFSPDQQHQLPTFTSPEVLVDKYASQVADTIMRQSPYIAASSSAAPTPIDDAVVQTDSNHYNHDFQVQVSEDFPYKSNSNELKISSGGGSSNTTAGSTKSGKKLRKKRSSLTPKGAARTKDNSLSSTTESETEIRMRRPLSKGSIRGSRRSSKKSVATAVSGEEQQHLKDVLPSNQPTETIALDSEATNTTVTQPEQETSNESEKFSELENVGRTSGGESEDIREEDLGIIEEDSTAESLTKAALSLSEVAAEHAEGILHQNEDQDAQEEPCIRSVSSLTYRSQHSESQRGSAKSRQSTGKTRIIERKVQTPLSGRSLSASSARTKTPVEVKRIPGSASSTRSPNRMRSTSPRPTSKTILPERVVSGSKSGRSSRPTSPISREGSQPPEILPEPPFESTAELSSQTTTKKRFPSPVSFISNPSLEEGTDHEEVLALDSEPTLQEAASVRRKSQSKSSKTSTPASSGVAAGKPGTRRRPTYTTSGKSMPPGRKGTNKNTAKSTRSAEDEVQLQERLLKSSTQTSMKSRIPGSQDVRTRKGHVIGGSARQNLDHGRRQPKGDSGYSDQMIHTSASDDQARFVYTQAIGAGGEAVRRRAAGHRPESSSSAKIIRRQSLLLSPRKSSRSTRERERKRYEAVQKSLLGELDGGLNASGEETTSHGGSGSFTSEEGYRRYQSTPASKRKQPAARAKLTFSRGEDLASGRTSPKLKNLDIETPISVTQAMQASMRKYNLERKVFQELLELKRLQIRSGKANEQVLVKRLADGYKKEGLSVNFREYDGPFTYLAFEKYLYDQLRVLQTNRKLLPRFAPSDDLEKLSTALKKMNATKLPYLDDVERPESICDDHLGCTHLTHRCHHAAHAYTSIPCAYYVRAGRKSQSGFLPHVDGNKAPGPVGQKSKSTNALTPNSITSKPFTPSPGMKMVVSPRRNSASPITLEVQQGDKTQVFSLPSQSLDPSKNYYVSLSIKPTPSPPVPAETPNQPKDTLQNGTANANANIVNNDISRKDKDKQYNLSSNGLGGTKNSSTFNSNGTKPKAKPVNKMKNPLIQSPERKEDDHFGSLIFEPPNSQMQETIAK